mgnify:CR=1 FL=1
MIKPIDGLGGHDVRKMNRNEIKNTNEFLTYLKDNRMFLEELIKQHKKMNLLCPSSVNTIYARAFMNCSSLTDIIINNGVKRINQLAFFNISASSITLPESIKFIESGALYNKNLK